MTGDMASGTAQDGGAETEPESWAQTALTDVGANIRAARRAADMTQEDLAARLGCTQTAVSYWEAGKRDPGIPDLLRIAVALGVTAASLLPDTAPPAAEQAAQGRLARVDGGHEFGRDVSVKITMPVSRMFGEYGVAFGDPDPARASVNVYDDEQDAREHIALYSPGGYVVHRTVARSPWERVPAGGCSDE